MSYMSDKYEAFECGCVHVRRCKAHDFAAVAALREENLKLLDDNAQMLGRNLELTGKHPMFVVDVNGVKVLGVQGPNPPSLEEMNAGLVAHIRDLQQQLAFNDGFVPTLKALGFHERFLEEYRELKMKLREAREVWKNHPNLIMYTDFEMHMEAALGKGAGSD